MKKKKKDKVTKPKCLKSLSMKQNFKLLPHFEGEMELQCSMLHQNSQMLTWQWLVTESHVTYPGCDPEGCTSKHRDILEDK